MTLEEAISAERLATYRAWAQHNDDEAMALYSLNVAISEAFYTALYSLEITLQNSVHNQMIKKHGKGWFSDPTIITDQSQQRKITEANAKFGGQTSGGQIVAELTFGFWTPLFGKHNNNLCSQTLRPMFSAPVQRQMPVSGNPPRNANNCRQLENPSLTF